MGNEDVAVRILALRARIDWLEYTMLVVAYHLGALSSIQGPGLVQQIRTPGALEFLQEVLRVSNGLVQADEEIERKTRALFDGW